MSGIPRTRRRLRLLTRLAGPWRQRPPGGPPGTWARTDMGANTCTAGDRPSFRRIVPIPYAAWVAALDSWQLTTPGGELRLGTGVLRGPAEHDRHLGTCRIEVRLTRGPLRPPLRMRLDIDHWSATSTALELIPCRKVRRRAAYFRAGHRLLDSLTHALPEYVPAQQHLGRGAAVQPDLLEDVLKGADARPLPAS